MIAAPGTVLVTGGAGFVGALACRGLSGRFPSARILAADLRMPESHGIALDLTDRAATRTVIRDLAPDVVLHLAAQSHVPTAFARPLETWTVNVIGTLHLLESLGELGRPTSLIFASTSEVYGRAFASGRPLTEAAPFAPMNPYAASKAAADAMVRNAGTDTLHTIVLRLFNHVGPGQREDFVLSAFAAQIARIEQGLQKPVLKVGNLDAKRDFLDVRDVVSLYGEIIARRDELPSGSAWNVCSERSRSISKALSKLLALSTVDIAVETDPERVRASEIAEARGDASALRNTLGWTPSTQWSATLGAILEDWRERIGG